MIDANADAIVQAHMDRVRTAGYTADALAHERATVEALAGRYREAWRADYLARQASR